ncbi:hypothetical protein MOQ_007005 [Trypanosoma cruzi marinkellei]|uniref:Uncharacterized protein n=1 Tax=Trypanosoma cruzi marinkellei TaxID=85056 RepID=K2NJY3_TRYCR|nr:hypothetical protein MOQ_007005 [Trypanosoma cruzi marinkellei]
MEQEGEGRSAADTATQRERERENMRRGQQAQPHSPHTTRQHPRKEGTQRQQPPTMQVKKTSTTISLQLIPTANGKWPTPCGHHTTQHTERAPTTPVTTASEPSAIHDAATKFPAIPPSMGHGAQLNAVTRGAPHPQERRLGVRAPSLLLPHGHGRQQSPHATASMHHKKASKCTAMCILCVCVCLQKHKAKREKGRKSNKCKGTRKNKMCSGNAWRKQQEKDRSNS